MLVMPIWWWKHEELCALVYKFASSMKTLTKREMFLVHPNGILWPNGWIFLVLWNNTECRHKSGPLQHPSYDQAHGRERKEKSCKLKNVRYIVCWITCNICETGAHKVVPFVTKLYFTMCSLLHCLWGWWALLDEAWVPETSANRAWWASFSLMTYP